MSMFRAAAVTVPCALRHGLTQPLPNAPANREGRLLREPFHDRLASSLESQGLDTLRLARTAGRALQQYPSRRVHVCSSLASTVPLLLRTALRRCTPRRMARMFGEALLELGVSFEDELKSMTDDVVELARPKEVGIAPGCLARDSSMRRLSLRVASCGSGGLVVACRLLVAAVRD